MEQKKNYKDTLLLPVTDFAMRGNLGVKEVEFQAKWAQLELYESLMKKNANRPMFVLHDGPPYANGSIHAGTALNKVLKDFVLRYKNMSGFQAPYIPGWDTHGLPIENALSKDKSVNRKTMTTAAFREKCAEFALEQIQIQKAQFRRLGVLGEWMNPYITLDKAYEAAQVRVFGQMVQNGLIYKGLKPVYWSPSSESALAEAEIEYFEVTSPSIYVAMPVVDSLGLFDLPTELLIWTTTPWTIPANLAITVGEDIEYVLVSVDTRRMIVAKSRLDALQELLGWTSVVVIKSFLGKVLEHVLYRHPLYDRLSPVILGDHVTTEDGSGLVHTAPGHGEDDYLVGQKYGLEVYCPVDDKGLMMESAGPRLVGLFVDDANQEVIKWLSEQHALLKVLKIHHPYPHDWRTKKPVIFRATPQWFASIDKLKKEVLQAVESVKWIPSWGEIRLANMVKDREAWCISRQRVWGVPIPIFYTEKGNPIMDTDLIEHVASLFEQYGSNVWFEKTVEELLPAGFTHIESPNGVFTKESDIMDVWFDSGTSHHGAMIARGLPYPADLYLEGSDQYRGWFNSSLITGVATLGASPYKAIVSHGFVLDGEGRKMSKSLGNVIDPNKISSTLGADIFRMWVSSVTYQSDVRISDELLNQVAESYRKVRNTLKFLLGNLYDFNPNLHQVSLEQYSDIDRYLLEKTALFTNDVLDAYEQYQFDDVYRKVNNFVSFISAFYLDFTKDILYIDKADHPARRAIQSVLYKITTSLLKLLTPIIPHTTSEAYWTMPYELEQDVYLTDMPKKQVVDAVLIQKYDQFMEYREVVNKALEMARNEKIIGKSLNASLVIYPKNQVKAFFDTLSVDFAKVFIVSNFAFGEGNGKYGEGDFTVDVFAAPGAPCDRCWQVFEELHDGLCPRCQAVIQS
jgi:isoleucyl-tRNA synthetase